MAGSTKGRKKREQDGELVLFANVGRDVMERLDAGAAVLGWSRARYLEAFIRQVQVDELGLPAWVHEEVDKDQLPLRLAELAAEQKQQRGESGQQAA